MNQQADYISRLIDTDDWQITNEFFLFLDERWGPHTVDCFANYYNHKLPKFFSRFWNPNTAGVDFFFQPLGGENCLVVPPVGIVPRVLHYMKCQYAVDTLVVPFWPSAHYWPLTMHRYGDSLVVHVIRAGRADATAKSYMRVIKKFLDWCKSKQITQDEITCFRISETWRKHATPCFRYVYVKVVRFRCIRSNGNARKRHETGNGNTGYPSCFRNGLTCFCHVSVYGFLQFRPV